MEDIFKAGLDTVPLDSIYNQELVDCLPGIFYLYEVIDEKAYLLRWNTKHETVTERTPEELLHAELSSFFNPVTVPYIIDCFSITLDIGFVKNVYASILTKSGKEIPYVFEAYRFSKDGKMFFMGMGMDVSDLMSAKEQIKLLELQKQQKEKELFSIALQEQQKEELLQNVLLKLEAIESQEVSQLRTKEIKALTSEIKSHFSTHDNWSVFKKLFQEIHYDFFETLSARHPQLTKGELKYCAYLKIQMHTSEICNIMNISKEGLAKKRYRLKKKLDLKPKLSIDAYISSF
ncbi:hypothetical protein [Formosa algae]|uniref:hypothetical protein n=1 Tax=Formosa algae TaxID=225843 RepID=UPI000CCE63AC|nr:hypothetical protein [Formosa algae]PNW27123.1 hypothetical protein BKP44_14370 [Formosa algae]